MTDDPQQAALEFLADPATHGLAAGAVRRIETHAAIVFLAGKRAYKVKRSVKYPYLDFSTLAKREAACRAELEANRPFSPELYLGVTAIVRRNGALTLGGDGEPVEWAVVMRRFDEDATLDRVAERGGIGDTLARSLGAAVAAAHGRAPRFDAEEWVAALGRFVRDEIAAMRAAPDAVPPAQVAALDQGLRTALDRLRPLLVTRGGAGHVVRGHGDLHLRNVALIEERPVLFDALEFDPVVAAGDVLYDLAFLLMDLLARGLDRPANVVFNRYLVAAGDDAHFDALAALPFFLALRAAIRSRVALDKRKHVQGEERAAAAGEAGDYAALAAKLIAPPPPRLVAIGGLSGTGKTTIATALAPPVAPAPGAVHFRSDLERKRLAGVSEFDRLPPESYTPEATARVYARLNELARRALAAGHSALVDAVHARAKERAAIESVAREAAVPFHGLWLDLPLAGRLGRVGGRTADASDADASVVNAQEKYEIGAVDWRRIDATGSAGEVVARVRAATGL